MKILNYLRDSKFDRKQVIRNLNGSFGTKKFHSTIVQSCPKAQDLAVPKIFVSGLSQRYFFQSQASQGFELMGSQSHNLPIPVCELISFFILNCFDNHSYQFLTQNYGSYAVIRSDKISTLFTVISKGIDAMHSGTSVQNRKTARSVSSIVLSLNFSD